MIKIHNFYLDIVYALYNYLSEKIPVTFYGLETNLGNAGLQLSEEPNFRLPRMQIDFQDIESDSIRPVVYQFHHRDVNGQRLAVHNYTNDLQIITQEEWSTFQLEIRINCDSHLQALDIKHHLTYLFPINKQLQHFEFISFFKIPDYLIDRNFINVEKDNVYNLYQKHFKHDSKLEYCFSLPFRPLIRVNSISLDIGDNNASSFPVSINMGLSNNLLSHIIFPWLNNYTDEFENKETLERKNVYLHNYNSTLNRQLVLQNITYGGLRYEIIDDHLINTDYEFDFGKLVGDYYDERYECKFKFLDGDNICAGKLLGEIINGQLVGGQVKGENIAGQIFNIVKDVNKCQYTVYFDGEIYGKSVAKTITFLYDSEKTHRVFDQIQTVTSEWKVKSTYDYQPGEIIYNIGDLNKYRCRLKDITLIEYNGEPVLPSITSINGKFPDYNLDIDTDTSRIIRSALDFEYAKINIKVDSFQNYGIGYINTIQLDINDVSSNIVTGTFDTTTDNNQTYNNIYYELSHYFNSTTRNFEVYLGTNYNTNNIDWTLFIPGSFKTSNSEKKIIMDDTILIAGKLKFLIPEDIYMMYFNKVSKINPLFLSVSK